MNLHEVLVTVLKMANAFHISPEDVEKYWVTMPPKYHGPTERKDMIKEAQTNQEAIQRVERLLFDDNDPSEIVDGELK